MNKCVEVKNVPWLKDTFVSGKYDLIYDQYFDIDAVPEHPDASTWRRSNGSLNKYHEILVMRNWTEQTWFLMVNYGWHNWEQLNGIAFENPDAAIIYLSLRYTVKARDGT